MIKYLWFKIKKHFNVVRMPNATWPGFGAILHFVPEDTWPCLTIFFWKAAVGFSFDEFTNDDDDETTVEIP